MTGATSGAGTAYSSAPHEFPLDFSGVCVVHFVKLYDTSLRFLLCCDVHLDFHIQNDVCFVFTPMCIVLG